MATGKIVQLVLRTGFSILLIALCFNSFSQQPARKEVSLNENWRSTAHEDINSFPGFEQVSFDDTKWKAVDVPHNWDSYEGYRRLKHGNRHGYAWYRKTFTINSFQKSKRYFLWFEGVGSYATVWLNGKKVGYHAGGRTSFTLDVTDAVNKNNQANILAVRADHPSSITDLPWVCGGCSEEVGFSEGSQPMGIFRPVHLIITDAVRVEPFGVHVWNDTTVSVRQASLHISTEVKNYGGKARSVTIANRIVDKQGKELAVGREQKRIQPGEVVFVKQTSPTIFNPHLWSLEAPYLYTITTEIVEGGRVIDRTSIPYGIRWIKWDIEEGGSNRFFLNGKPVFLNGTAEYEHMMGQSHAFSSEQIRARVMQVKAAGYNAFRDAHQPHNLRYHQYGDELGILWWTQHTAHIWFDTPAFRENFKATLKEWVKERRNSPSLVLWGLQNESQIPEDFARECTAIIRTLDPITSSQRKVTTCNGGKGTDWNVPQNWTGTYGGNPREYDRDVQRQVLIGEYGAWRSLGLHTDGPFDQERVHSEEQMTQLMEMKVRLAESVRDQCAGHFHWLLTSHENPGRVQGGEGFREMDRIGPVNYKGLFTTWGEPLDIFYMFRSNYVSNETEPMVYISSHTWPDRWTSPGVKDSIIVYSNCDEVELFNGVKSTSLGRKSRGEIGTHFQWDGVRIKHNVLFAVGYVDGKEVATDVIILNHLPSSPDFKALISGKDITVPEDGLSYIYRVNCGGPSYTDMHGALWMADVHKTNDSTWGSLSWTDDLQAMPAFFGSQRKTNDPISGTADWPLFQHFRYGRDRLRYEFPVPEGTYIIELYFSEPWYGTGGGLNCDGWRLFDVAVNDETVIRDLDIWSETGHDHALKKTVRVNVKGGMLSISFPDIKSGQAVIAAIAIASENDDVQPVEPSPYLITNLKIENNSTKERWSHQTWLDTGCQPFTDDSISFSSLPPKLHGAEWIRTPRRVGSTNKTVAQFRVTQNADVFIGINKRTQHIPEWMSGFEDTQTVIQIARTTNQHYRVLRKRFAAGEIVHLGGIVDVSNGDTNMYTVAVIPATQITPAIDLRPSVNYKAEDATKSVKGVRSDMIYDRTAATFTSREGSLQFSVSVGVADLYALRFRYVNHTNELLKAYMKIVSEDGTVMKEEPLEFPPTPPGKWKLSETTTGTMINAGSYHVELSGEEGLSIRSLDVQ